MDDSTQREELVAPTTNPERQDAIQPVAQSNGAVDQNADDDERVYVLGYN